jgi:uncharacterized protein with HEPN domain
VKTDRVYLLHIRDALERVVSYTKDGRESFFADAKTQDAVIRNLEVIGEAVKQLSRETTERNPDVPWNRIAGMRDLLIHHYFGVKLEAVWNVVEFHWAPLSEVVQKLLAGKLPGDSEPLV